MQGPAGASPSHEGHGVEQAEPVYDTAVLTRAGTRSATVRAAATVRPPASLERAGFARARFREAAYPKPCEGVSLRTESRRLVRLDRNRVLLCAAVGDIPGDVDRPALADHRHLHLARVFEVVLDLPRDLV